MNGTLSCLAGIAGPSAAPARVITSTMSEAVVAATMDNIHTLSTFQLRQVCNQVLAPVGCPLPFTFMHVATATAAAAGCYALAHSRAGVPTAAPSTDTSTGPQEFNRLELPLPDPCNGTTLLKELMSFLVREHRKATVTVTTEEQADAERDAIRRDLEAKKDARKADGTTPPRLLHAVHLLPVPLWNIAEPPLAACRIGLSGGGCGRWMMQRWLARQSDTPESARSAS
jgi:hypothetical protein